MATVISSPETEMSFNRWCNRDMMSTEHRDHWSKLRCKYYSVTKLPTGNYVVFCKPEDSKEQTSLRKKLGLSNKTVVSRKGTLAPVGNPEFNKYLKNRLHNPYLVKPKPPTDSRGVDGIKSPQSSYYARAKLGYEYWYADPKCKKPKPERKVILGAKGSFLGLGVPRL